MRKSGVVIWLLAAAFAAGAIAPSAMAQDEPAIRASLSESSVQVGGTVLLTVEISGGNPDRRPDISIDGLAVQFRGQSTNIQMQNFNVTRTTVWEYAITPLRGGEFTIPAIEVDSGGQTYSSEPQVLEVSGTGSAPPTPGAEPEATAKQADYMFASLIVPRESIYEGEAVPIETRLYFDSRIRFNLEGPPVVQDEGFIMKNLREPGRAEQVIDGVRYNVLSFRSAATPAKAGQLNLGPSKSQVIVELPVEQRQRRDPFDSMFQGSPFGNPFGNVQRQRAELLSEPVTLDVKPLPATGRPGSFNGAVGQFMLEASTLADKVSIGDPVTVSVTLDGRGDFTRVMAPVLSDESGWRSYPPTAEFSPNDDLGLSGLKTFQIVLIPEENHTSIPPLEFSYFDPSEEEYVVLRSDALPLIVEGTARVATPSGTPLPADPASAPEVVQEPAERDILHVMAEPSAVRNFEPVWASRVFWASQAAGFGVIAAWALAMGIARRRNRLAPDPEISKLHSEFSKELAALKSGGLSDREFANRSTHALRTGAAVRQQEPALQHGGPSEIAEAWGLNADETAATNAVFEVHDAATYAGDPGEVPGLSAAHREKLLQILKSHEV